MISLLFPFLPIISSVRQVYIPGDILLGGLFPIHEATSGGSRCGKIKPEQGIQRMVAMLFAIESVNREKKLLQQATLGAYILDSCSNDNYGMEQSLEFIKSYDKESLGCEQQNQTQAVVAVVGDAISQTSIMVASLLRLFEIPQVSYSATVSDLSDRTRFNYFSRTVPPDTLQTNAIASIIQSLEWNYVHAIGDTTIYGERGIEAFRSKAADYGICIDGEIVKLSKTWNTSMYENLLDRMRHRRKARGVVVFADVENLNNLLQTLNALINAGQTDYDRYFWFIATDSWGIKQSVVKNMEHRLAGAITVDFFAHDTPGYLDYYRNLSPVGYTFLEEFFTNLSCSNNMSVHTFGECFDSIGTELKADPKVPFVVDTITVIAHALDLYMREDCGFKDYITCGIDKFDGMRLQRYYRNVSLNPGEIPIIDANGDGIGRYDIFQLDENGTYVKMGWWHADDGFHFDLIAARQRLLPKNSTGDPFEVLSFCSRPCSAGQYKAYQDQTCCWNCIPCDVTTSVVVNETKCIPCPIGWIPDDSLENCIYIKAEFMDWNSYWAIIPAGFSAIGFILTGLTLAIFVKYSNSPVILASGRELCYCMLLGIALCYGVTFFHVSKPSTVNCTITPILMGASMSAVYSAIITKTLRVSRVFAAQGTLCCIKPQHGVAICSGLVAIPMIFFLIWFLIDPPETEIVYPTRINAILTCKGAEAHLFSSLSYNFLLVIVCTIYAFKTRKIPEKFNETHHIGYTMYSSCVLWLAFMPIYFATQNNYKIQITSLCICISFSGTTALICFFVPKLHILFTQKPPLTRQSFKDTVTRVTSL